MDEFFLDEEAGVSYVTTHYKNNIDRIFVTRPQRRPQLPSVSERSAQQLRLDMSWKTLPTSCEVDWASLGRHPSQPAIP